MPEGNRTPLPSLYVRLSIRRSWDGGLYDGSRGCSMISGVMKFLEDNFFYLHPGYTPLNTLVFGLTVGLIVLIIMKMFRWLDKDPGDLFAPLIPFIFLGSCARALVDNGVYPDAPPGDTWHLHPRRPGSHTDAYSLCQG